MKLYMSENKATGFKRRALLEVIKTFDEGVLDTEAYHIPFTVIPPDAQLDVRCCVYKERAVFRARVLAALGYPIEEDDEATSLNDYARQALERTTSPRIPLTVLDIACKGCKKARHLVTEACQQCVHRACQNACKFGAISVVNGRSYIDPDKCQNCGQCKAACPYNAITFIPVPCEQACPVDAIHKDENGLAEIDFNKCISCGRCMDACLFGAIMERSQIVDILKALKHETKVCALIAPSIVGQFESTLPQLITALKQAGFDQVTEVAAGADITTANEAKELLQRLDRGDKFMTTSCCSAWVQAVKRHLPQLQPHVSETKTPMSYTADLVKKQGFTTVFIGPCVAKRMEGLTDPHVDYVMTFEELGILFEARGIKPATCKETPLDAHISGEGRYYGVMGSVAKAVQTAAGQAQPIKTQTISGLDKKTMLQLQVYANTTPDFQLLEVMSCKGGCIGGPCTRNTAAQAIKPIQELVEKSPHFTPIKKEK